MARIGIVKAVLQLTPEQAKYWPAVEEAIRGRAQAQYQVRVGHPSEVRCAQNHSLLRQYFSTRAEPSLRSPWLQATSRRHSSTASPSPLPHSVALNSK